MKIVINDKEIIATEGQTVLEAALSANIYIPHLCSHPDLEAVGGCRLCVVENTDTGEVAPSCMTTVTPGLSVQVDSEKAQAVRKLSMELILATHPGDCTGCPKYGNCELQSMYQYMGVGPERWRRKTRTVPADSLNPLISHDFTRCVRCGRCIRACKELRGVNVLDYVKNNVGIHAGIPHGKTLEEAGCKFCGACIEVCPTGSIMDTVGVMSDELSYSENVVPCRSSCPGHTDVPRYVRAIKDNNLDQAVAIIRERVPFPKVLGRVCDHPCESACKRGKLNSPVSICRLKRKAADDADDTKLWKASSKQLPPTGKKVGIIGGGPAGLTGGYYLAKQGHSVTVFEENSSAGGQCRYGIPEYRLPAKIIQSEIDEILSVGINLQLNTRIEAPKSLLEEGFDAVLIAIGTHKGNLLPLEGGNLPEVTVSTDFLKSVRSGNITALNGSVMVLGGGNVAFDCGRTAIRLGAQEVHLACLEAKEDMLAASEEITEGIEEGVILHPSQSFVKIHGNNHVEGVELRELNQFSFKEDGSVEYDYTDKPSQTIPISTVIFATGQKPKDTAEMGLDLIGGAYIKTDKNSHTSHTGIFSGGDVVTGTKSVINAIAEGRKAAENIDRFLGGSGDISEKLSGDIPAEKYIGKDPDFAALERHEPELTDEKVRKKTFDEVVAVFQSEASSKEAYRCLQCDLRLTLSKPKLWNEYER